jgi:hypothetical protein
MDKPYSSGHASTAPRIVEGIEAAPNAHERLLALRDVFLMPALTQIEIGENANAYQTYRGMVEMLEGEYHPTPVPRLVEQSATGKIAAARGRSSRRESKERQRVAG